MSDFAWNDAPFEDTAILPEQFFSDRRKYEDPIQRLMLAVLDDAIRLSEQSRGPTPTSPALVGGS